MKIEEPKDTSENNKITFNNNRNIGTTIIFGYMILYLFGFFGDDKFFWWLFVVLMPIIPLTKLIHMYRISFNQECKNGNTKSLKFNRIKIIIILLSFASLALFIGVTFEYLNNM